LKSVHIRQTPRSCSFVALPLYGDTATPVKAVAYPEIADVDPTGRKS